MLGKIKNFIKKFIVLVIVILIPLILILANPGNPVYASTNPNPSIAGGLSYAIALKSDGTVWSWGNNAYGQLGDGTGITRYTPVEVQGLSGKTITAVTAGDNSSYFLASDGTVWAVGYNNYGQLGDGTTTSRNLPVEVKGLSGKTITTIAAGTNSAYFLASDGTVWSVGLNNYGQLGDGTTTNKNMPVQVQGLSSMMISDVAAGQYTAYFLVSDGTVWSVGYNNYGQLGDGTTTRKTQPIQVQGLSKTVTSVAAGFNTAYFLVSDGTVWSVGLNGSGQLGDGTTTNKSVPIQVQGLSGKTITTIAAGTNSTYFLASDGTVWAVGYNNYGQLGDGTTTRKSVPVQVQGLSSKTIRDIAVGQYTAYFLASDGAVWAVGASDSGQLGDGSVTNHTTPVQSLITLIPSVVTITSPSPGITNNNTPLLIYTIGVEAVVKVKVDGAVVNKVSGSNLDPLTDGVHTVVVEATDAGGKTWSSSVTFAVQTCNNPNPSIAGGLSYAIALKGDGTVWSWGNNAYGQIGDGTGITRYTPVEVQGLSGKTITAVTAGDNSSYFLASDGTVWAVGYNNYGQLGDGTTTSRNLPVEVKGLSGKTITTIAAGTNSAYFLASDGTVWSVGLNNYGQLGDGTTTNKSVPVQVQGLSSMMISDVAAGQYTAYFLASDGTVWSVGYNNYGQLGDGTTTIKTQPIKVQGLSSKTVTSVAAGFNTAYFLVSDGTVWSVGLNGSGQLGDGTTTNKSVPVQVQGLSSKTITDIAAGTNSTYFLASDGTVWAVGYNNYGQLGDGTTTNKSVPVQVQGLSSKTISDVAAGQYTAYFLASDGAVWAVGASDSGQLGDGSVTNHTTPVQSLITLIPSVVTITSPSPGITYNNTPLLIYTIGVEAVVKVKVDGAVVNKVSGSNLDPLTEGVHTVVVEATDAGGKTWSSSVTFAVQTCNNPYPSIAGGSSYAIALKGDGTVWSWGDNTYGQLGDGTGITKYTPVEVQGLSGKTITAVAAGYNSSYFLASDGTVWSVGYNNYGQLGDGTTTSKNLPVGVQGLSGKTITAIAAGQYNAYFLASDGTVWSVGLNGNGQLGDSTTTSRSLPVQVQGLSSITIRDVAAGQYAAYFLASDGTAWSVGLNGNGQLGDGTTTNKSQPVKVQGLSSKTVTAVAAGINSAYFLASDGTVWSVGVNNYGQLGDGTTTSRSLPVQVQGLSSITIRDVAAGQYAAYFLASDGTVWSIGLNNYGQLGDGTTTNKSVPVQVQGLSSKTISDVAAGQYSAYFLASDGAVWSVGYNSKGQLGDNSTNNSSIPVQVSGLTMIGDLSVTAVNKFNDINVANGTTIYQLGLPSAVMVDLDNGTVRNEPVSWDSGTPAYNGNTGGTYKFTGTLTLPSGVSNPNGYTATVNVIVGTSSVTVTSVNTLNDIEVTTGTSLSQVGLSDTVIISLNNGSTTSAAISWDGGTPAYDGNTDGTYKFIGTLSLPSEVTNPNGYTASVNVIVGTSFLTVTSVNPLNDIEVTTGTSISQVGLLDTVIINLNNGSATSAAISWDGGTPEYDGNTDGIYKFIGTLTLPSGVSNPKGYTATVNVIVGTSFLTVTSVNPLNDIKVTTGTSISQVGLLDTVIINLNNGSTTSAAISWDGGTPAYDGNTGGTYKFTGTLILPSGVYNPNGYTATVNVIVGTSSFLTVTSVNPLNDIEVTMGTSLSQVGLLDTVIINLNNGSTTSAAISWDGGTPAYDGNTGGTYKFNGTLTLPSGVSNPNGYTASVNVIVSTTNIMEGDIFDYVITGTHLTIPTRTVTITYNPDDVQLIDLFGLTTALDTMTSGPIPGTNITINQNTAGTINFTVNLPISSETSWSGVLNSIKFKAKVSHPRISYTVQ